MVHFRDHETASYQDKLGTKRTLEDDDEEALNKRNKASLPAGLRNSGTDASHVAPSQYDPLSEPSPLGLSLRKSPSLLDLIERKLSQGSSSAAGPSHKGSLDQTAGKETKGAYIPVTTEKLKASNFAASLLRIGSWEYKSRYAGDLVVKCYFAKHKLVWEALDGGLKSKIEIQWSDITGLKADCAADGPGTLTVVLARQPLFFRESSPQPRKHTLWHATTDFTDGEASKYRQHFLQCPQGLLNKHFEKIIHCDMRLNFLSRQPAIVLESPFFEQQSYVSEGSIGSKINNSNEVNAYNPEVQSSFKIEQGDPAFMELERQSQITPFGSDVLAIVGSGSVEASGSKGTRSWEQMKVPGLHPSFSMGDLVNHIGNYITEQMTAGNPSSSKGGSESKEMLDEIAEYLLADTQCRTESDEKLLMARVNSLCCLLQLDSASAQNLQSNKKSFSKMPDKGKDIVSGSTVGMETSRTKGNIVASKGCANDASSYRQSTAILRKDSLSDLLFRIRESEGCANDASSFQQAPTMSKKDSFSDLLFNLAREKASGGCANDASSCQQTAAILRKDSLSDVLLNLPRMKASERCANDASSRQQTTAMSRKDSFRDVLLNLPQMKASEGCANDASSHQQTTAMSRKDSFSDLLLNLPQMKASEIYANDASSRQQTAASRKDSLSDLLLNLPRMKASEGCSNDASSHQQTIAMSRKDSFSDLLFNLPEMKAFEGYANDASSRQQTAAMSRKDSLSNLLLNLPRMKASEGCSNDASSHQLTAAMSRKDSLSDLLLRLRAPEGCANDTSSCQQTAAMSRIDSLSDLLFDLPRIESLPKFLNGY